MKRIHLEVTLNQIIGLVGGWLIVFFTQPLLQNLPSEQVATTYSILFFIWSYSRSFLIRLVFERTR